MQVGIVIPRLKWLRLGKPWPVRLGLGMLAAKLGDGAPKPGWCYREGGAGGGLALQGWMHHEAPDGARWIEWFVFDWLSIWVLTNPGDVRREVDR